MIRRLIIILIFIHLMVISSFSQNSIGLKVGPNYSKFKEMKSASRSFLIDSEYNSGLSTTLSFNHEVSSRLSYNFFVGHQILNNYSGFGHFSMRGTSRSDGNYTIKYISLGVQQRFSIIEQGNFGLIGGGSFQKVSDARFTGHLEFQPHFLPESFRETEYVDNDITGEMNHFCLYYNLGFDYIISLSEKIRLNISFIHFRTLNGMSNSNTHEKYYRSVGYSVSIGCFMRSVKKQ